MNIGGMNSKLHSCRAAIATTELLYKLFKITQQMTPRIRTIHKEELWLYKNEVMDNYVSTLSLWLIVILIPVSIMLYIFRTTTCWIDVYQCILGLTLSIPLTLCVGNFLKIAIGRPRPDFFWRCFPDNRYNEAMECTGDHDEVIEGRKSFPSNHASLSFASLGYMFFYLFGKWHCCSREGLSDTKKLMFAVSVLLVALAVSVSRIMDHHHHAEDVLAGGVLGMTIAYMSYRHVFPALSDELSHFPYCLITHLQPEPLSDEIPSRSHSKVLMRSMLLKEEAAALVKRFRERHNSDD